jgi:hypothetical protein
LAHQQAEREVNAICKELDNAQTRIDHIIAEAHDRIIEEQVFNSAKAKSKAATAHKRHQKKLKLQQMEFDDAINQMHSTLKDNNKKALRVCKRKQQNQELPSSISRRIIISSEDGSKLVSAAKINDLEMKVAFFEKTQAELKKSHENAMAELMLSQQSKVEQLVSTHAINLEVEKSKLHQCLISEHQFQNELCKEVLEKDWFKRDACKSVCLLKQLSTQQLERMKE